MIRLETCQVAVTPETIVFGVFGWFQDCSLIKQECKKKKKKKRNQNN